MLTKDENIVDVTVSAQYRIANLKDFVLNVKDPETSLRNAIESALRHVVGDNTLDQTLTVGRENIASRSSRLDFNQIFRYLSNWFNCSASKH